MQLGSSESEELAGSLEEMLLQRSLTLGGTEWKRTSHPEGKVMKPKRERHHRGKV